MRTKIIGFDEGKIFSLYMNLEDDAVSSEINNVIVAPDLLRNFLDNFYIENGVDIENINLVDEKVVRVKFFFPQYKKTLNQLSYNHISANQLQEALIKGCYLLGGHVLLQGGIQLEQSGNSKILGKEDFEQLGLEALLISENRDYTVMGVCNESYIFDFYLISASIKNGMLQLKIGYNGIITGSSDVVVVLNDISVLARRNLKSYRKLEREERPMV